MPVVPFNRHEAVKVTRNVRILGCIWQLYLTLISTDFPFIQPQCLPKRILSTKWPNTIHIMNHQNLTPYIFTFFIRRLFWLFILKCCSFCSKLELSPPHSMPGDRKSGQNLDPADQWLAPGWHPDDHGTVAFFRRSWWRSWGKRVVCMITFVFKWYRSEYFSSSNLHENQL